MWTNTFGNLYKYFVQYVQLRPAVTSWKPQKGLPRSRKPAQKAANIFSNLEKYIERFILCATCTNTACCHIMRPQKGVRRSRKPAQNAAKFAQKYSTSNFQLKQRNVQQESSKKRIQNILATEGWWDWGWTQVRTISRQLSVTEPHNLHPIPGGGGLGGLPSKILVWRG